LLVDGAADEDELMLAAIDAGADDIVRAGDAWQVSTAPTDLHTVRTTIEGAGFKVLEGDLTMVAQNLVPLEDTGAAKKVLDLIDALEDIDDVQDVYGNFDIPNEVVAQL
jgi:transcriptional/translational regulatory protein YebC/TACO1